MHNSYNALQRLAASSMATFVAIICVSAAVGPAIA